jgi:MFS family permease
MPTRHDTRYENTLRMLLFFAIGFVFFDRLAINFLFPFMRGEFELTNARIGLLTSALALTWALSGFALSAYADTAGRRKPVLVGAVVVFSLCSISSGLAGSFFALLAARAMMGLAEGPVLPIGQSLMLQASSPARRGFNMGFIQASAGGLLGAVLTPMVIVPVAESHGWRFAFYCAGVPGLLIALLLARLVREPRLSAAPVSAAAPAGAAAVGWRNLLSRNTVLCTVLSCLFITWFLAIVTFSPVYLLEQRHMTPGEMGLFMTVLGLSSVIGGFAVPALSDRIGRRPTLLLFGAVASAAPLVIAYLDGAVVQLCIAIFVAYLGYGCFPIFLATVPAESVGPAYGGRAIAVVIGVGEVVGGFVSPLLIGVAADAFGPTTPFLVASGCTLLALLVMCGLRETAPRRARGAAAAAPVGEATTSA